MVASTRIVNICSLQRPLFTRPIYTANLATFSTSCSSSSPKVPHSDEDADFLPWLQRKAGVEISSLLSIVKSAHGRSLVAAKPIHPGDCMLKVPYNVQIAPDNLPPRVSALLPDELSNVAKLAVVIIVEQKKYQQSEWAPYISRLPKPGEMHNTVFWSDDELEMIRRSSIYEETTNRKTCVAKEFSEIKSAFESFPEIFDGVTFNEFLHACTLGDTIMDEVLANLSLTALVNTLGNLVEGDRCFPSLSATENNLQGLEQDWTAWSRHLSALDANAGSLLTGELPDSTLA